MICIICGTNRPNNESQKFVGIYQTLLKERGVDSSVIFLEELPHDFIFANDIIGKSSVELAHIIKEKLIPATKLVIIAPEYNGSFPGVLKAFIDSISPKIFLQKTIALVGISAGRSGNLRGIDHLTSIFHYLDAEVLSCKIDIARINDFNYENEVKRLNRQIDYLVKS